MYKIETTATFDKQIKKLDIGIAKRIIEKAEDLSAKPDLLRYPLKHLPDDLAGLQKYKVGDWRILFWVNHQEETIILYFVEHRSKIYRKLKKRK